MVETDKLPVTPEQAILQGSDVAAAQAVNSYSNEIAAISREISSNRMAVSTTERGIRRTVNVELTDSQEAAAVLEIVSTFVPMVAKRSFRDGFKQGMAYKENQRGDE